MSPKDCKLMMYAVVVSMLAGMVGCNNASKPAKPAAKKTTKTETSAKAEVAPVPVAETQLQAKWVYLAEGRRDPFQPFVLVKRAVDVDKENAPLTPIQQYETQQYKLNAIVIGYGEPMAMVLAPDGKSYVIRKGNKIGKNGGRVVAITSGSIVVEEKFSDVNDKIVTDNIEIKLPKREGV